MISKASTLIAMALSAVLCISCTKETRENAYIKQEELIEKFVNSQHPGARVTYNGGSTRITVSEGDGMEVNARGRVSIHYAGYNFKSGTISSAALFVTNNESTARSSNWDLADLSFEPVEVDLSDKDVIEGLRNGLEGVREGEECYILFCGKYAFGKSKVGVIPANAPLAFHIWVETIEN